MTPKKINDETQMVEDLAESLKSTTALVKDLLEEFRSNTTTLAVLKEKVESLLYVEDRLECLPVLKERLDVLGVEVDEIYKTLKTGNGEDSVITRLSLLERSTKLTDDYLLDVRKEISDIQNKAFRLQGEMIDDKQTDEEKSEEQRKFRHDKNIATLSFWGALLPGLIALGCVIVQFIMK